MPSKFVDFNSSVVRTLYDQDQHVYGHRHRSSDGSVNNFNGTTSGPTSTSTTRSSISSTTGSSPSATMPTAPNLPVSRRQRQSQATDNVNPFLQATRRDGNSASEVKMTHSSRGIVQPTASIQEWAHRVHIQQKRKYDWCGECNPQIEPLQVPTETIMRRVRIQEPTHCYE